MTRILVMGAAALLSACTPIPPDTAPAPSPVTGQVASLAGEWRVAGVDGSDFDEPYGLALGGDASSIWWNPRCAGEIVPYRIDGVVFLPRPAPEPEPGPVCMVAIPARLPDVMRALRSGTRIERTAANGVLISGGGHSLLLFSQ